jgi:lipopolysaccharide export system protein LptA
LKKAVLLVITLFSLLPFFAQKGSPIIVERSDFADVNEVELPGAVLLTGNVKVNHEGITMTCNKAYFFKDGNYIKTFGDVQMVQGDTLTLNSKYAEYNGNIKKAYATGDVVMKSPESTMTTDTVYFDRNIQEAYFNCNGTIVNKQNTLKSKSGRYYVKERKYQFLQSVVLTNPEYTIKSNHLDYYTKQGNSFLKGPSTITGKDNFIYTENGFYNSKKNIGNFKKNSYIKYKDRLIVADSLYYDRKKEFASGTNNVKITDSINKAIIKGHYGEVYKNKDSLFITKHASIRYLVEKDSMFVHAKRITVTGKVGERLVRGQKNVRLFKSDISAKCDSIHSSQKSELTQLLGKPILWNFDKQLTGDVMHLIGNNKTEKIDSLKVLNNAFIISKDTVGAGFNQIKGLNLYAKFLDNKIHEADVVKNTEVIYYMRNDKNELIGINKSVASRLNMILDDKSKIETLTLFDNPDGDIYPEKDLPENARKLRGFEWRGDERIKSKEEIYPQEEIDLDKKIVEESRVRYEKEKFSNDILEKNLLDQNDDDAYFEEFFRKYNNRIVVDKNFVVMLVKNCKFRICSDQKAIEKYTKNNKKYSEVVRLDKVVWNWNTMNNEKWFGGFCIGNEIPEDLEFAKNDYLTLDEIIKLYHDRIIIDKNGIKLLVKDNTFKFPLDNNSFTELKKKKRYQIEVRINQIIWVTEKMKGGIYDGGTFNGNE